jgi:tetratricopeptide (TPR) repeat protein
MLTTLFALPYTFCLMADDLGSSPLKLQKLAIDAAINCQWEEALAFNFQLIKVEPENIECLNRIAKAHFEMGDYNQAKKFYTDVLKLDPYNTIAQKNLKRVSTIKKNGDGVLHSGMMIHPSLFIEEPGMTKSVTLVKAAEPQKLLTLSSGQMINLVPKKNGIVATDQREQYLGALPDDIAHHLLKLLEGGNKYQALIKNVKANSLTILVRETFRSKKFKNQASFLDESRPFSYSSDNITLTAEAMPDRDSDNTPSDDLAMENTGF